MRHQKIDDLYFSASALSTYDSCKLKFKKRYLEGLYWPSSWNFTAEKREQIKRGENFHLLAERYYSRGQLERKELIPELKQQLAALVEFRPFNKTDQFFPEQELRFNDGKIKLLAKYDLVYKTKQQVIIYDWKTGGNKPKLNYWQNSIQTLIYRYLLVKASGENTFIANLDCEDITLIYWNPNFPNSYQPLNYSQAQYERDEVRINNLLNEILTLAKDEFYATKNLEECQYCEYRPICHGKDPLEIDLAEDDLELDLDWEEISMVEMEG